ncbi:hypothetical protein LEMLEM_LOCUS12118, partial [Lemmus lemmus]
GKGRSQTGTWRERERESLEHTTINGMSPSNPSPQSSGTPRKSVRARENEDIRTRPSESTECLS